MTTMPTLHVSIKGEHDPNLIRTMLTDEERKRVRFFAGQGRTNLATLGQTLLAELGPPVLVVLDSETLNPDKSRDEAGLAAYLLGKYALPGDFGVHVFIPGIEAVFFEAPPALERILGRTLPPHDIREGLLASKQALERLMAENDPPLDRAALVARIDARSGAELAAGKQASALLARIRAFLHAPVAQAG